MGTPSSIYFKGERIKTHKDSTMYRDVDERVIEENKRANQLA